MRKKKQTKKQTKRVDLDERDHIACEYATLTPTIELLIREGASSDAIKEAMEAVNAQILGHIYDYS